jgi:pilus assembly protein Flp/PilA
MDSSTSSLIAAIVDESGVTAIEYGLLAALIVVTAIGAISASGTSLGAMYKLWTDAVAAAL